MSWDATAIERINPESAQEVADIRDFLGRFGLRLDTVPEYTVALRREGRIIATGSLDRYVLRNIAVDEQLQGEGLAAAVVGELIREAGVRGIFHYFLFTKPAKAPLFAELGFGEIARTEAAAVLEAGIDRIADYLGGLRRATVGLPGDNRAAIVMNCNPFTKGHQALVETAARDHSVIVFVVSEDLSLFPFADRLELVRAGVAHLPNVAVVAGGKYIISAATFPAYFTRAEDVAAVQARLDATVFAARIAPALGIGTRFVGEEPYCPVTAGYNRALAEVLPRHGVTLRVIPRVAAAGAAISASAVREAIRRDDRRALQAMLPPATLAYLESPAGLRAIEKIRQSDTRH